MVAIRGPEILIPLTFFIVAGTVGMSFTPIGRAIARRLGGGRDQADADDLRAELSDLRAELDETRARLTGEVEELHNRVDFAERVIAQGKDRPALPGSRP